MATSSSWNQLSTIGSLALVALTISAPPAAIPYAAPKGGVHADDHAIGELIQRHLVPATNARDYAAVRTGLTDDWTYFTSAGMSRDFESWKAMVSRYTVLRIEMSDIRSRLSADGTLAWSTFIGRIQGEVDGSVDDRRLLYTAIFVKTDDGWKLRHLHATASRNSARIPLADDSSW